MATATQPQPIVTAMDPEDLERFYEVVNGQVVENPPMGANEGRVASRLVARMGPFAEENGRGEVVTEVLFTLSADLKRRPDVAFVSADRWPREREIPEGEAWDVVPDLAVEVISPSNSFNHVVTKIHEYFRAGVRQVWVIAPRQRVVQIYESPEMMRGVPAGGDLDGGAVLPGFRLPLSELIPEGRSRPDATRARPTLDRARHMSYKWRVPIQPGRGRGDRAAMIRVRDLRVDYDDVCAVRDLPWRSGAGEVCGLIGPNGAGKTTTMRAMLGLIEPTYGEIEIAGVDIRERPARGQPGRRLHARLPADV